MSAHSSSAKHTPGPWVVDDENAYKVVGCAKESGIIAETSFWWYDKATARANARLIAAAPEMLEALELMVENEDDALHGRRLRHPHKPTLDKARAAIRVAKGESNG